VDPGHIVNRQDVLKNRENVSGRSVDVEVIKRSVPIGIVITIGCNPFSVSIFITVDNGVLLYAEKSDAPSGTRM